MPPADFLRQLFEAAVAAAQPSVCLTHSLPDPSWPGRTAVLALGKAAPGMAAVAAARYGPAAEMLVVCPHGAGTGVLDQLPVRARVIRAGHPVPDAGSLAAGQAALAMAGGLGAGDCLIALVSGGGSALMCAPVAGLSLAAQQHLTRQLLASGLAIQEINAVRSALSRIKGGRLAAAAAPARVVTRLISDIPGDDPALIASGPTVLPRGPAPDAAAILSAAGITLPAGVTVVPPLTGQPGDDDGGLQIVASADIALQAAGRRARSAGLSVRDLGGALGGSSADLAARHAALLDTLGPGTVVLSGGEATVALGPRPGQGGRNLQFLLALALALPPQLSGTVWALAADTDGIDGTSPAAGAVLGPHTLPRARALGLDPAALLAGHRAHDLFAATGDLIITGPTGTNVNDFRAVLLAEPGVTDI